MATTRHHISTLACGFLLVSALSGCMSGESESDQLRAIPVDGEGGDEPCVPEDCEPIAPLIELGDCPEGTEAVVSSECVDDGGMCLWEFTEECVPVEPEPEPEDPGDGGENPGDINACETAFAMANNNATCFLGADFDDDGESDGFNRWGWSNGPIAAGTSSSWSVYASAGQCDTDKGTLVGFLSVRYDGSTADIEFNAFGDHGLSEEHLYVGNDALASNSQGNYTVAPGLYPIGVDLDDAGHSAHSVGDLSGDIYVVYHAVVCD